jgi:hypothetical protein
MDNDALAPVIAVMLILAIGVTVFAVYTSTYLPGLKQQDEVDHLQQVESGFVKFSSDIDNAIAAGSPDITYSEQIPLGGGDILINSLKSSGTIRIQNESQGTITINGVGVNKSIDLSLVNYSYQPEGNYWVDQGYIWREGYVNVTKGNRSTPLQYNSVEDPQLQNLISKFSGRLVHYYPKMNEGNNGTLQIIQMVAGTNNVTSNNGIARLILTSTEVTRDYFVFPNETVQNLTMNLTPETGGFSKFSNVVNETISSSNNNITVRIVRIEVGVN